MQPRKNFLPWILASLVLLGIGLLCVVALIGVGVLAWILPVRSTSNISPTPMVESTVEITTDSDPISHLPGMPVRDVRVEIGVGSPIPVEVVASGEWSTTCAQLEQTNIRYVPERQVHIELLSNPGTADCTDATEGLPFNLRIPLNMVEMPSGRYSVNVNGVQADFDWQGAPTNPAGYFPGATEGTHALLPVTLREAHIEVGSGSPIPVDLVVAGEWPSLCSQLAQVTSRLSDRRFSVDLLATPPGADCPPDLVGLSFGLHIPLNMLSLQPGTYTFTVNGLQASFEWPTTGNQGSATPGPTQVEPMRMAYIGADGNVWLVDYPQDQPIQLTIDASSQATSNSLNVEYNEPKLTSDGKFVAYRRALGVQQGDGLSYTFGLWVVDLSLFNSQEIYAKSPAGFTWQPNSHLLAYTPELEPGYFTNRADSPNSELAQGIWGYDADTTQTLQLVSPERGYALYAPVWSPDGRFLSFDELLYMEGRGPFAYYDFTTQAYIAWEEPLGMYSWSPDGESLAFDNLTYTATGDEQIFIRSRQDGVDTEFSPKFDPGFASMPAFSPAGDQVAYLANLNGPETSLFTLIVQPYPQGEPNRLGEFDSVFQLNWSPGGERIVFSAGLWGEQHIIEVDLFTGDSRELTLGMQPSLSVVP